MPLPACTREQLLTGLKAAAAIEALLTEEEWLRRYDYIENWTQGVDLATFSNGSGDEMFILSCEHGVIIKGFDHESDVSPYARDDHSPWPGIFEGAPSQLLQLLDDAAIRKEDLTFLHWLPAGHATWRRGNVTFPDGEDDGSGWLIAMLPIRAEDYIKVARDYFEKDFDKIDSSVIHRRFGG